MAVSDIVIMNVMVSKEFLINSPDLGGCIHKKKYVILLFIASQGYLVMNFFCATTKWMGRDPLM